MLYKILLSFISKCW